MSFGPRKVRTLRGRRIQRRSVSEPSKQKKIPLIYHLLSETNETPQKTITIRIPETRQFWIDGLGISHTPLFKDLPAIDKEIRARLEAKGYDVTSMDHKSSPGGYWGFYSGHVIVKKK